MNLVFVVRVDDPRNLIGHLGLLQTTITGFPMVSEMDTGMLASAVILFIEVFS